MSKTSDKTEQPTERGNHVKTFKHPIHPYFTSNSKEETLRRMKAFPERAAKFLEQLRADREANPR